MPEWTSEQLKAIDSRDGTVLVSAAAGSGKTAVLVERVIRRLMDKDKPCSADRLLIVTFTRAATQQMRDRIFKAISDKIRENPDDAHLRQQLVLLPFARISTIDSFCNDIVRENFHDIDITPDYKMLEGAQLKLVESDAMSRTLDEQYKENSDEFSELVNIIVSDTKDDALGELIHRLYRNAYAFAEPEKWLDGLFVDYERDEPLKDSRWGQIIIGYARDTAESYLTICEKMRKCLETDETARDTYTSVVNEIESKLNAVLNSIENDSWDDIGNVISQFAFSRLPSLPKGYCSGETTFIKAQREKISEGIRKGLKKYFCATEEENRDDMNYLRPLVRKLIDIVKRYGEILQEEKRNINSVDFADISHYALKLLISYDEDGNRIKTKLAKEISQQFDEVLVDEFQDINELQSTLFWAVSKNDGNMFTVGDVKQSIYGFRQAMPEIFLRRRDGMPDYEEGVYPGKIILDRNFRSRSGVTENINFVFRQLMKTETGGLNYDKSEELVPGAKYDPCSFSQTEFHLIGELTDKKVDRDVEAEHIANVINEIMQSKMQVSSGGSTRDVQYRDICILMRSTGGGKAEAYAGVLAKHNIPAYVSEKSGFFEATEISSIINFMRVIDNPVQDIPLLAVLLSAFCGFTPDELAEMRIAERNLPLYNCVVKSAERGNAKSSAFLEMLEDLRMLSSTLSCTDFLNELYDYTGCRAIASAMKNGSQRCANLNMLLEYASKYEAMGRRGLSGFIRFIDRVQQQDGSLEAASDLSEAADVVRIMTIHKSKGLEFPVCIIADLGGKITNDNTKTVAAFHPDYGICFDVRNSRTKVQYPTLGKKALILAEKYSSISEELRILYVAMTRAKERLICIARYENITNRLNALSAGLNGSQPVSTYQIRNAVYRADWLTAAFMRHPDAVELRRLLDVQNLTVIKSEENVLFKIINDIDEVDVPAEAEEDFEADEDMLAEIKERIAYEYPYSALAPVMAKSAPSSFEKTSFDTQFFASSKPQFLSKFGINPAKRGTATHKFMEFFDYSADNYDIGWQIDKMLRENHITQDEADILERDKLKSFFDSDIAKKIKASPLLLREKKVTVGIPAGKLYAGLPENVRDENVVIQGYVDCAFEENGELIIVDYKTDRNVTMDELKERYGTQLKMYEFALSECTGKKVSCTLIYSFEKGEFVSL